jgi:arylsulfatase A
MRIISIAVLAVITACLSPPANAEKPNFVVIYIDDLGYGDIGPFGATEVATPNLDRMAAEGRRLTSHYGAPVCSPSRAALMTGCYPKRALPIPGVLFPASEVGLHPNEMTLAEVLKEQGYATGCIGKWHLGDQPGMLPNDQGFDYYYGIPFSNDMGPIQEGAKSNPRQPLPRARAREATVRETGIRRDQPPLPLLENRKVIDRLDAAGQTTITRRYTERAVQFLREQKEGPFLLYMPHTAVHFPLYPALQWRNTSQKGLIGDWIQEVDWSVGQVMQTLRELGLEKNTMVLFTSDNGGALRHGSNNMPLRGGKGSTWEGGIRVCTVAWWPGQIPAGTSTDAITSMMDILPTLAGRAGAQVPEDRVIDGVDIWPALTSQAKPRDTFYYFRGLALEAVRHDRWKLHLKKGELYDLAEDVAETGDLSRANPAVVSELRALAAAMDEDLGVQGIGNGCRPLGRHANPQPLISIDGKYRAE